MNIHYFERHVLIQFLVLNIKIYEFVGFQYGSMITLISSFFEPQSYLYMTQQWKYWVRKSESQTERFCSRVHTYTSFRVVCETFMWHFETTELYCMAL